jgi:hypothetical protein
MRVKSTIAVLALTSLTTFASARTHHSDADEDTTYATNSSTASGAVTTTSATADDLQPSSQLRPLAKRWGAGLETIPGAGLDSFGCGLIAVPNAVSARYWVTDRLAVDGMLSVLIASQSNDVAIETEGGSVDGNGQSWGFGVGVRYNLTEPSRNLMAQLVGKASFADSRAHLSLSENSDNSTGTYSTDVEQDTTAMFLGVGFEAFVPGWNWLSLEGSLGLSVSNISVQPINISASSGKNTTMTLNGVFNQNTSTCSLGGSGFSPINVSIHYYF